MSYAGCGVRVEWGIQGGAFGLRCSEVPGRGVFVMAGATGIPLACERGFSSSELKKQLVVQLVFHRPLDEPPQSQDYRILPVHIAPIHHGRASAAQAKSSVGCHTDYSKPGGQLRNCALRRLNQPLGQHPSSVDRRAALSYGFGLGSSRGPYDVLGLIIDFEVAQGRQS